MPGKADPGFIDHIFDNVVVIAAARAVLLAAAAVLLFAGVYIVISVGVRMARGQWLRRAGPFESELAEQAERLEEVEDFFEDWMKATDENEELAARLGERDDLIRQLLMERAELYSRLEKHGET